MINKQPIKNYNPSSVVKEFYNLNTQFLATLIKINKLLDDNKISEALNIFDQVRDYNERIEELKENLPDKDVLEKENFLLKLRDQQAKITEQSEKTDHMLKVHLEIAKNIGEFVKDQLIREKMADIGYNSAGTISSRDETLRPVAFVSRI